MKSPDTNVEKIRELFLTRSVHGVKKYGTTTDKNPLSLKEWLRHAMEEAMDFAVYCQAAITEIERNEKFIINGPINILKLAKEWNNANRNSLRKNAKSRTGKLPTNR